MQNRACNCVITPKTRLSSIQHRALLTKAPSRSFNRRISAVKTMAFAPPQEFGWICLVLFSSVVVHHVYMAVSVGQARKRFNVKYPAMYADSSNKDADAFNCIQRAHQNSLENYPQFLACLLVAGLWHPITAAIAGAVYLIGRIFYFRGYATGNPDKRLQGAFFYFALFTLYGIIIKMGVQLLRIAA